MKATDFNTIATGNGVPCNGDLIETKVDGINYRAEFYLDDNCGHPVANLAADSCIEKQNPDGSWEPVTDLDDDAWNELANAITPEVN